MLNLHFSVNCKAFQSALAFLIFRESFSYSMDLVYRRLHLSGILSKLGHFLLLKRKFSYHLATKPSSIYFVKRFLKSKSFQEIKASSTISCKTNRGDKIILKAFEVGMYTKLISHMVLSTQEKSSSTANLRYSCPRRLPKIPRKLFATQQLFKNMVVVMDNPF